MLALFFQTLALLALGAACGLLGGLFGVGGGVIAIPLLGMLYAFDQQTAQGTVLLMVVPNVLLAFWRYRQRFGVDLRMAVTIGLAALSATYPAARVATGLDPHLLRLAFAAFLAILSAVIGYRTWHGLAPAADHPSRHWLWSAPVGIAGGIVSGFFGVGGAFIAPPLLTGFLGLRQLPAQGLALALVSPAATMALVAYAEAGQVAWPVAIPLAIGGTAAISAGVAVAHRFPERRLRLAFCAFLTISAVLLALHA